MVFLQLVYISFCTKNILIKFGYIDCKIIRESYEKFMPCHTLLIFFASQKITLFVRIRFWAPNQKSSTLGQNRGLFPMIACTPSDVESQNLTLLQQLQRNPSGGSRRCSFDRRRRKGDRSEAYRTLACGGGSVDQI